MTGLGLFLSSYSPLFALLAVRFDAGPLRWSCVLISATGTVALAFVLWRLRRLQPVPFLYTHVHDVGSEASAYLATYLLPFLTVAQPSGRDVVAYGGYLAVAGVIYVRSSLIQVNPLLYLLGYRVYGVRVATDDLTRYVLSRQPLPFPGGQPAVVPVTEYLSLRLRR